MSETFEFWHQWVEIRDDGSHHHFAEPHSYDTYQAGLERHRRATRGEWVEPHQAWPEVSDLVGVTGSRSRAIRSGVTLWTDDRRPLTREGFAELRKQLVGKIEARMREAA